MTTFPNRIFSIITVCLLVSLTVSGCAGLGNMFGGDDEPQEKLKGERISIMELQTRLEPNEQADGETYTVPTSWKNDFWPQQGGYPNHAMHNPALPESPLVQAWRSSIGRGSTSSLPLSNMPIVIDGKIFTMNTRSEIYALSAETGERLWRTDVAKDDEGDSVIGGGIAASRNKIYVTNGYDEALKLDSETGEIEWRVPLPTAARAAPTILGGRVFIQTLGNEVVTLAASDGDLLWTHRAISETSGLLGAPSPAANNDVVVPGYSSGEVFALRIENGGVAWQDNLSPQQRLGGMGSLSDIRAMPVLDRGLVIAISFGGRLVAIDQRTGRRIWQREIGGSETPWVSGDSVFVLSTQNRLVSFERETGDILWVRDLPRFEDDDEEDPIVMYGPVMGGGRLFVTSSDSVVYEIDPVNGEILTSWETEDELAGPAVIASETLFLLGESGRLMAYR